MKKFNSNSISRNNKYNGAGGGAGGGTASDIAYDNSLSGLVSENVQQAIDELHDEIEIGNIYTTDEKKVGEWIDGKPIYEKTVMFSSSITATGNTWKATHIDNTNINKIIKAFGLSISNSFPIAMSIGNVSDGLQLMHFRNSEVVFDGLIYQYTKTTD